ncbi:MAG TPA: DUF4055 domain-containing protein [Verrucomicrobiota bacterium]|jgi:hypothetical protein|nr:DUF4055 domain-containing protein [Verrucomicrobiota bacterium]HQL79452.1 DUF4055 domain-containing protein [Verrucomicrobiota bacterium]
MAVNVTHPDYDAAATEWARSRDVLAGEDAVKAGGEKYLPRLDSMTDEEFSAYVKRASYFNASARTSEAYLGLMFRRPPFVKLPDDGAGVGRAMSEFQNDADMLGTTLTGYAKMVVGDVVGLGRAGSLVDWEDEVEQRAYVVFYRAEQIINWRVERVNGRNVPTLIVLAEHVIAPPGPDDDGFALQLVDQMRVLRLVPGEAADVAGKRDYHYQVELWQPKKTQRRGGKVEWELVETRMPLRLGKPLPLIPFVFHGSRHSRPDVDRGPLEDIVAVNLDHYRLNADFKHGLHFTALPTAWVSGFDKGASLRIGSSTAWVSETPGATAGFLEFTGQGLTTHERAMDRDERLMSILGSRMLEDMKKVGETATAIELRQAGEYSILGNVALSVSESLTQVLRWVYWWNSTEELPDDVKSEQVLMTLNTDFSTKGLASQDIQAIVAAWQAGAISQDSMYDLFRRGEVLPEGRTNQEEAALIEHQMIEAAKKALAAGANGQSQMVDGKTNGAATGSALPA